MGKYAQLVIGPAGSGKVSAFIPAVWLTSFRSLLACLLPDLGCIRMKDHTDPIPALSHTVNLLQAPAPALRGDGAHCAQCQPG